MTCVSSTTGSASTIPMRSRGGRLAASIHRIADKVYSRKPSIAPVLIAYPSSTGAQPVLFASDW
jgi:hypothetical protein